MIPDLSQFLRDAGVIAVIFANLKDGTIKVLGDSMTVTKSDLVKSLFGDAQKVKTLDSTLEGQLLPRMWSQGNVKCVVCKPTQHDIVGLVRETEANAIEQYEWANRANEKLLRIFGNNES